MHLHRAPKHVNTLTLLLLIVISPDTHLIYTLPLILNTKYFQQDCDAENIWSMGNSQRWYTQKRSLDPSQTEIMTNIHLDVRGGKWEGHKTTRAYDILWCGVCVMRCWSNTYNILRQPGQLHSVFRLFSLSSQCFLEILSVGLQVLWCHVLYFFYGSVHHCHSGVIEPKFPGKWQISESLFRWMALCWYF